ncbi:MAG: glucose-6-phosphate isomerase, partial [Myxococcota bacterium]
MSTAAPLRASAAYASLEGHRERIARTSMRELFASDPARADRYAFTLDSIYVDFSKHQVDDATWNALFELARERHLEGARDAMFRGDAINTTEGRAVLHTALRNRSDRAIVVNGRNVMDDVRAVLTRLFAFASEVERGERCGATNERFTHVVNIGIGGSDLGPVMVTEALKPYQTGLKPRFVSNID